MLGPGTKCWGESDRGLIIDIATALFINCVHARNVVARWPNTQPKPLQPWLSPESGGTPWECGRSVINKIRPLQTVPGERDLVWTQGLWFELFLFLTKGGLALIWVSSRIYPSTLGSNFWEVEVGNGLSRPLQDWKIMDKYWIWTWSLNER